VIPSLSAGEHSAIKAAADAFISLSNASACVTQMDDIQGTVSEHSVNIQRSFMEHSVNIQGTFSEHSGNFQGTFRDHSGNIQRVFGLSGGGIHSGGPEHRPTFLQSTLDYATYRNK
jgi:hypothetical protein